MEYRMYDNAKKGLGRIYFGELLQILSTVLLCAGAVAAAIKEDEISHAKDLLDGGAGVLGILLAGLLLMLVAFLFTFFGVKRAAKDEAGFNKALIFLVIGIIATIAEGILINFSETAAEGVSILNSLCDTLVTIFIIRGTMNLAENIGNMNVKKLGSSTLRMILLIYALIIALQVISLFFKGDSLTVVALILLVAVAVLSVIAYILFLKMLNQGRKML